MGSGLSCFGRRRSGHSKGFHPSCQDEGKEKDSTRGKGYVTLGDCLSAEYGKIKAQGRFSVKVIPSLTEEDRRRGGGEEVSISYSDSAGITTYERTRKRVSFKLPGQDDIIKYDSLASEQEAM